MEYVLIGFAFVSLFLICISLERRYNRLKFEMNYISNRVEELVNNSGGYVLEPSENEETKKLAISINHLLEKYYLEAANYKKSYKSMQYLFTNISHDFRTPLTVLNGYTEILMLRSSEMNLHNDVLDMIRKINDKAQELVKSINEIFSMAKLKSGDVVLYCEKLDISALCREILLQYYDVLEKDNIRVYIKIGDKPLFANVDEDSMKRVIKNLIDNAVKYGKDGKYLGISLTEQESKIEIAVEDHGAGIKKYDIKNIFRRKYTSGKGSGLGLSIVYNLVSQMGGTVEVKSEPGIRTVFYVYLKKLEKS